MNRIEEHESFIVAAMQRQHAATLAEKERAIDGLKEQLKKTEYAFKGACGEHLSVRVELTPAALASGADLRGLYAAVTHASRQVAYEVERRLGERYALVKAYSEAIQHIRRMENHTSHAVFARFEQREFT